MCCLSRIRIESPSRCYKVGVRDWKKGRRRGSRTAERKESLDGYKEEVVDKVEEKEGIEEEESIGEEESTEEEEEKRAAENEARDTIVREVFNRQH